MMNGASALARGARWTSSSSRSAIRVRHGRLAGAAHRSRAARRISPCRELGELHRGNRARSSSSPRRARPTSRWTPCMACAQSLIADLRRMPARRERRPLYHRRVPGSGPPRVAHRSWSKPQRRKEGTDSNGPGHHERQARASLAARRSPRPRSPPRPSRQRPGSLKPLSDTLMSVLAGNLQARVAPETVVRRVRRAWRPCSTRSSSASRTPEHRKQVAAQEIDQALDALIALVREGDLSRWNTTTEDPQLAPLLEGFGKVIETLRTFVRGDQRGGAAAVLLRQPGARGLHAARDVLHRAGRGHPRDDRHHGGAEARLRADRRERGRGGARGRGDAGRGARGPGRHRRVHPGHAADPQRRRSRWRTPSPSCPSAWSASARWWR